MTKSVHESKQTGGGHLSYHPLDKSWVEFDESNPYMKFVRNQVISAYGKLHYSQVQINKWRPFWQQYLSLFIVNSR